ncbi:MAG TPA: 30S ribosomal protein S12 methylthiotransferase RimO [Acidimicrobiales bacterium]|nr:30S ribosomal protein S12 methylthiotransferase RimO [Acidimicrobiales bacterium]
MEPEPARCGEPSRGESYWVTTLGCPKNEVDSAKLTGHLASRGYTPADRPEEAGLIVVNTCAFIEPARAESIETILDLAERRRPGARIAVTGCLAERHGAELAAAMPEIDLVAGFGLDFTAEVARGAELPPQPVRLLGRADVPSFDLLELPRPAAGAPWAYVKVAEGCDRRCGFCAIPSFRGRQRSRQLSAVLDEVDSLEVSEVVLVAQDLASYGRDRSGHHREEGGIVELVREVAARVAWVRLLYLYPSSLTDRLIDAVVATGVPYFDLSLQHVSAPLLRRMRRWGSAERFLERIERIRQAAPEAALRSSFILGYPGETEADHDELLAFLEAAELDWVGLFTFSREAGTFADGLPESLAVPEELALDRLAECAETQEAITSRRRAGLVGSELTVMLDRPDRGRTYREAPEIDGVVRLTGPHAGVPGSFVRARCTASEGPDLIAEVAG